MDKTEVVKIEDMEPEITTEIVSEESLIPDRQEGTHSMEIVEERMDGWIGYCKNCKRNHFIPKKKEVEGSLVPEEACRDMEGI